MIRSLVAVSAGLLTALILQTPAAAGSGATNGSAAPTAGVGSTQTPPATPHAGPQGRSSTPNRPAPSGQRGGPRPSSGTDLIDDNQRWNWWDDAEVKRELALTDATVESINNILRERFASSRPKWQEFSREKEKLNRMLSEATVSEESFELQVMKVDRLGSELETSRTLMLFRIRRQLRPDQIKKLEEIALRRAQRDRDRSRGSGPGRQ